MATPDPAPSERREFQDPVTGAHILQLTARPAEHLPLVTAHSSFTPTGDTLLFVSTRGPGAWNLFRMPLSTGELIQVTGDIVGSGQWIVGSSDTDRGRHAVRPDAPLPTTHYPLPTAFLTPAADGRRAIAALAGEDGEIAAVELETGEWETLAVFPDARLDGCHLSASGEYVVTVVTRAVEATLTAVHTEGMRTVPILEDLVSAPLALRCPRFSPDSRNSVLYHLRPDQDHPAGSPPHPLTPSLRCVEFDGSHDRQLYPAPDAGDAGAPPVTTSSWLGAGDEVLCLTGPGPGPLLAVPRPGGAPRVVTSTPCLWARSSPTGDRIAATFAPDSSLTSDAADRDNRLYQIALLDPRSGEITPLATGRSGWTQPTFSPDGRSVLYADRDERGHFQLYLVTTLTP